MAYTYPYISDPELYKATIFACKMIRQNGYFNKAVNTAAKYYHVSADDVAAEVRKRQSAGQKKANREKPKKTYSYYAIRFHWYSTYYNEHKPGHEYAVKRATSEANARAALPKQGKTDDIYGWAFLPVTDEGYVAAFKTKAEAEEQIKAWYLEDQKKPVAATKKYIITYDNDKSYTIEANSEGEAMRKICDDPNIPENYRYCIAAVTEVPTKKG